MTELEQARLIPVEVSEDGIKAVSIPGIEKSGFAVQFNPASLRLQRSNTTSGQPGQRAAQSTGNDTTLSVELLFDTADEGTTDTPVDVRRRTGKVAAFVLPIVGKRKKNPPPGVRFRWGSVDVSGVMTSYSEDIELFDPSGTALRARVSITIKEQDPELMSLRRGPGAANGNEATPPGGDRAGPGRGGSAQPDSTAFAQAGETLPELATRAGLDPEAWRALSVASDALGEAVGTINSVLGSTASVGGGIAGVLAAGARVDFSSTAALGVGIGAAGASADEAAGFEVSAAGGVTAMLQASMAAISQNASASATAAFGAQSVVKASVPRPRAPRLVADRRGVTYGAGVPLRPRRSDVEPALAAPYVVVGAEPSSAIPVVSSDPRQAPWEALPVADERCDGDKAQRRRSPGACSCHGCSGGGG